MSTATITIRYEIDGECPDVPLALNAWMCHNNGMILSEDVDGTKGWCLLIEEWEVKL